MTEGTSIDDVIKGTELENINDPEFDISENGINVFDYSILSQRKTTRL